MGIKEKIRQVFKVINSKQIIAVPQFVDSNKMLHGKTVLITGGSGGIGFEIARKCIQSGAKVIITGTNKNKLQECVGKLDSKEVKYMVFDLNDVSSFESKVKEAAAAFEENVIDVLVNCAGINPKKNFFDTQEKDFDLTMDINVKGTFFISQVVANYMIKNKVKGHILNLSSSSALRPAWSPYEMSKWTIRGFTKGLADILIPYGIIVNAIAPGPTATPMLGMNSEDDLDLQNNPSKRYATPEEIANLAVMLISDMGNLVVGDTLYATGGSGVITLHN